MKSNRSFNEEQQVGYSRPYYIAIEGPIGVGKSTLVSRLAQHFSALKIEENIEENPFLARFYEDREKYAFQTQLFFLLSRYRQQQDLWQTDLFYRYILSDYIFAKDRLFASINLSDSEILLYNQIYQLLDARILKPDLVVYLQARVEIVLERIKHRGRNFERNIDAAYLRRVLTTYNDYFFWYSETPLLVVDTSDINLVDSDNDFLDLSRAILRHRKGTQFFRPLGR